MYGTGYRDENNISNVENPKFKENNHYESFEFDFDEIAKRLNKCDPKSEEIGMPKVICPFIKDSSVFNILRNEPFARFKTDIHSKKITDETIKDLLPYHASSIKSVDIGYFSSLNLINTSDYSNSEKLLHSLNICGIADTTYLFKEKGSYSFERGNTQIHPGTSYRGLIFGQCEGLINTILSPLQLDEDGKYELKDGKIICPTGVASYPGLLLKPRIWYYDIEVAVPEGSVHEGLYDPSTKAWYNFNRECMPSIIQNTKKVGIYWEPVEECVYEKFTKKLGEFPDGTTQKTIKEAFVNIREANYAHFMCTNYSEPGEVMYGFYLLPK